MSCDGTGAPAFPRTVTTALSGLRWTQTHTPPTRAQCWTQLQQMRHRRRATRFFFAVAPDDEAEINVIL